MNKKIVCSRCVMDTTAKNIHFNSQGICNYCIDFKKKIDLQKNNKDYLNKFLDKLKLKKGTYNCLIGLSGGIDSCYTLHKAIELGLKPLVVHMDNGWNSELAQNNIENLAKKLNVDLYTHVIDWREYRDMMNSFFKADVLDVELLMDNAMLSVNYSLAAKYNINYILAGTNINSEGMAMPPNMNWIKYDKRNIIDIIKKFGNIKIKTYPIIGTFDLVKYIFINRIKWVSFLDYFNYNKYQAIKLLKDKYNFKPYPYKHYESVFTRFYQGYILPNKFGIDKRILHLSTLIISKQITRNESLKELEAPYAYPSEEMLENDKSYFLKKMGWSTDNLDEYIKRPEIPHDFYKSEIKIYNILLKVYKLIKVLKFY